MENYAADRSPDASRLIHKLCAGLVATAGALALSAGAASAATITVNTILDEFDVVPNANCSLREAIESANQNASLGGCLGLGPYGNDTIVFDAGVTSIRLSIIAPSGGDNDNNAYLDLDIGTANSGDLTIQGGIGGVSVQPVAINWADRIVDIVTSANVTLTNLTIQGGVGPFGFETGFNDPCFGSGGGVRNRVGANLTLNGVTIQGNIAPNDGGGLCQFDGALRVLNSVAQDNEARAGSGGGLYEQSAQLLIENSAILSNTTAAGQGGNGGGLWMSGGVLGKQIVSSTIAYNRADASGGGLYHDAASRGLIVLTSVVLSNTSGAFVQSTGNGGGIWNGSSLAMTGTAVLSNTAVLTGPGGLNRGGGGVYQNAGILRVYDSTLAGNRARHIQSPLAAGGGLHNRQGHVALISVTIQHNLVDGTSSASREGGGVFNNGRMSIADSQVDFNRVDATNSGYGGGIANWDFDGSGIEASLLLHNSSVSSNTVQASVSADGGGVFNVGHGGAEIINSVLRNNAAQSNNAAFGGGIYNAAPLTVTGSSIVSNSVVASSSLGGGVYYPGLISDTRIYSNSAMQGGGVHMPSDGGRLINSDIRYNTATGSDGGGLHNSGGDTQVIGVTICDNTAARNGGGVSNDGTARIAGSVMCNNTAVSGGGVYFGPFTTTRRLELVNSTLSGNTASNGGGLYVVTGTAWLTHTTIASNTSGLRVVASGAAWARATLLAYNAGGNCIGLLNNAGFSMSSDATCGALLVDNPLLRPLALNGGPTLNHALPLGSPALDKVPAAQCDLLTDQRGVARPQSSGCDVGAFEMALRRAWLPAAVRP